jgi:dephospho-CoA kinase
MNEDPGLRSAIVRLLGEDAYLDGELNRAYIARKVFSDVALLESLNTLVHPAVRQDFLRWEAVQDVRVVVQESALIFENDMGSHYHRIILVTAPLSLRVDRVCHRDGSRPEEVMSRIRNQMPDRKKLTHADYWVSNILRSATERNVRNLTLHLKSLQLQ